jgi:hypothetical protein
MGRILVHDFRHISHGSSLGRARPNRRVHISPFRWVLQMKKRTTDEHNHLAALVYIKAIKEQIEKEVESKYKAEYLKRIEHLVGANNELMKELEQWERVGTRLEKATNETATRI